MRQIPENVKGKMYKGNNTTSNAVRHGYSGNDQEAGKENGSGRNENAEIFSGSDKVRQAEELRYKSKIRRD